MTQDAFNFSDAPVQPKQWNHRYVQYARAHGKTAEEMADIWDKFAVGTGPRPDFDRFIIWHGPKLSEFAHEYPRCSSLSDVVRALPLGTDVHAIYDAWLTKAVDSDLSKVA